MLSTRKLEQFGVPAGPIYTMDEVFDDPQVKHLNMAPTVNHHALGEVSVVRQPLNFSRTPARMICASPDAGEHTDEILTELTYSSSEITELKNKGIV